MKYICDKCQTINEDKENTSGHGYCPKCEPAAREASKNIFEKNDYLFNGGIMSYKTCPFYSEEMKCDFENCALWAKDHCVIKPTLHIGRTA